LPELNPHLEHKFLELAYAQLFALPTIQTAQPSV
jgi:hypothetical protein